MEKLKVFTAFSGYDSQCMALDRLGIDYELVGWSEIDKYAIMAHNAVYPDWKDRNLGDICKIDWSEVPDFDLFTYSFPCTDISSAGQQKGLEEGSGTRSSLLWECKKAIETKKPKYLLMENVKALTSKKFLPYLKKWIVFLDGLGYSNYTKVLNAKDYGVPQNRERVFVVSILGDEQYEFPKPFELKLRLKDVLESNVDEKYYLSKKMIDTFHKRNKRNEEKGNGFRFAPTDGNVVASAVLSKTGSRDCDNYVRVLGNTNPSGCGMNGNVFDSSGISPTLTTNKGEGPKIKEPETIKGISVNPGRKLEFRGLNSIMNVCPTLRASDCNIPHCVWYEPNVLTPKRTEYGKKVRKAYESGEIQESRHNMTEMQPREDGISNTITTVQKDNLLIEPKYGNKRVQKLVDSGKINPNNITYLDAYNQTTSEDVFGTIKTNVDTSCMQFVTEPKTIQVCNILEEKGFINPQRGRVYSAEGISPTINTFQGGGKETKIVTYSRDKKGKVVNRRLVDIANTIHTSTGSGGNIDSFVAEPIVKVLAKFSSSQDSKVLDIEGISSCHTSGHNNTPKIAEPILRIRKLTPRECFRLMGVTDADIDKIQSDGISKTQQYKMSGNSIVVDVLYYIFRKMFVDKTISQLTLF